MKKISRLTAGLTLLAAMLAPAPTLTATAAAQESASRINTIKKDGAYIWGESIATDEQAAAQSAKTELAAKLIRLYPDITGDDANALADGSSTISAMRGNMHRVFAYIVKPDPANPLKPVKLEQPVITPALPDSATVEPAAMVEPVITVETVTVEEPEMPALPADGSATSGVFASLPASRTALLDELASQPTMDSALAALARMRTLKRVRNYGDPSSCANADASHWLVECASGVAIFTPKGNGESWLRYPDGDSTDSPANYRRRVWFRP